MGNGIPARAGGNRAVSVRHEGYWRGSSCGCDMNSGWGYLDIELGVYFRLQVVHVGIADAAHRDEGAFGDAVRAELLTINRTCRRLVCCRHARFLTWQPCLCLHLTWSYLHINNHLKHGFTK